MFKGIAKRWKKKSLYKKSLILFTLFLFALSFVFLTYVFNTMVVYERNLVDNYIKYLAESGKITDSIDSDLFSISKYEKKNANIKDGVKKLVQNKDLKITKNSKESTDKIFAYDLLLHDKLVARVHLKEKDSYIRMAILTIKEWDVEKIETFFKDGIYHYTINVPSDYKVLINNIEVDNEDIISEGDIEGLDRLTKYIEIYKSKTYEIKNLVTEADIKILDASNKEVQYDIKDGKITINNGFKEIEKYEDAKEYIKDNFDVMKLARDYSLILTNDLGGELHGFYKLSPYLIKDSYMYEYLRGWATQVDITFVSNHRLKNPAFTNESLSNFIIYNDNAFSVEVSLEKNMIVNGEDKVDKMHDRMYFVYYENGYKLVDMKSL